MRLLTEEEIREAKDEGWKHYISCANRQDFTEIPKKALGECEHGAIAKKQRDLTHKETLKEVGEWLERRIFTSKIGKDTYHYEVPIHTVNREQVEAFKRGEMPEEVK